MENLIIEHNDPFIEGIFQNKKVEAKYWKSIKGFNVYKCIHSGSFFVCKEDLIEYKGTLEEVTVFVEHSTNSYFSEHFSKEDELWETFNQVEVEGNENSIDDKYLNGICPVTLFPETYHEEDEY